LCPEWEPIGQNSWPAARLEAAEQLALIQQVDDEQQAAERLPKTRVSTDGAPAQASVTKRIQAWYLALTLICIVIASS